MKKIVIFSLIPIFISILLYGNYIYSPFGTYDIWFERIVFGKYNYSELPAPLQNINIPTDLKSYIKYRAQYIGRTPGSVFISYFGFYILGNNPVIWRIFLFFLMFLTFFLMCLIFKKFKINDYVIVLFLILTPALLARYFIKIISIIYAFSHLFFLMALYLELINSSDKYFKLWKSVAGSVLIFLSIFIRELQATAVFGVVLILIFWHNNNNIIQIKFKINFKRILPYIVASFLYIIIFYGIINYYGKHEFAYANAINRNLNLQYFKNSLIFILKYIGLSNSAYLGLFFILISFFVYIYIKIKYNVSKLNHFEIFKIVFSLSIIIPSGFLISLLAHPTGSFTIHILSSYIVISVFIQYFLNYIKSKLITIAFLMFYLIYSVLHLMESKQESHDYIEQAYAINKIALILLQNTVDNEIIQFKNLSLAEAYSLVTELFINKRRLGYYSNDTLISQNPYINYLRSGFKKSRNGYPNFIILKTYSPLSINIKNFWVVSENERHFSMDKILVKKFGTINHINPLFDYIHKMLLGYSLFNGMEKSKTSFYYIIKY